MPVIIPDPRWEMPELLDTGRKPVGNVVVERGHHLIKNDGLIILKNSHDLFSGKSGNLVGNLTSKNTIDLTSASFYLDFPDWNPDIESGFLLNIKFQIVQNDSWNRIFSSKIVYNAATGFELTRNGSGTGDLQFQLQGSASYAYPKTDGDNDLLLVTVHYDGGTGFRVKCNNDAWGSTTITALQNGTSGTCISENAAQNDPNGLMYLHHSTMLVGSYSDSQADSLHTNPYQFLIPA